MRIGSLAIITKGRWYGLDELETWTASFEELRMPTTRRRQTTGSSKVYPIQPNQGGQALAPNAFLGKPEGVPQIAYVREKQGDGFLTSAKDYYKFFGLTVQEINSVAEMVEHLSTQTGILKRVLLVSHAHERGMLIPMFTGAVRGTNADAFSGFADSDLEGLKVYSPFETSFHHAFDWDSRISNCMAAARTQNSAALAPFGLDQSGSPPPGDLLEFFKYCFDIVYVGNPGRVSRNAQSGPLNGSQKAIVVDFVTEILNQLSLKLANTTVAGHQITSANLQTLKAVLTSIPYASLNLPSAHPNLGLQDDSMNDLPSLQAAVQTIRNGFRTKLNGARQRFNSQSWLDIRGCRAGKDEDYVESLRKFFGATGNMPNVSAPRKFQAYHLLGWTVFHNRGEIGPWLGATQFGHSSVDLKAKFGDWADLIRLRPLHTDFWKNLLQGRASRFGDLSWRPRIPALFIPAPGLAALNSLTFAQVIGKLKDYFNVPTADVPGTSALNSLQPLLQKLGTYNQSLLAKVAASASQATLQQLYTGLKQINDDQSQSIVPATAPNPLTVAQIQQYQNDLGDFLDNTPLAPIKKFMTSAGNSLDSGDGLYYYMILSGVPIFMFGRPELPKNRLIVFQPYQNDTLKAWYKCLWKDALPSTGPYKSATIDTEPPRHAPALVDDDRTSIVSICPLPRYNACIRKRPLPADEVESDCDNSSIN